MQIFHNTDDITSLIYKLLETKKQVIVLIAGNSRSGKTTLSNDIEKSLSLYKVPSQIIRLDDWIINVEDRKNDMNVYERFNSTAIEKDFGSLFSGNTINLSAYDSSSRGKIRKSKKYKLIDKGVIIIEGVVALGLNTLLTSSDFSIFITIDENERKKRFFDFYIQKGLQKEAIDDLYTKRITDELELINQTKDNANIIYQPSTQ